MGINRKQTPNAAEVILLWRDIFGSDVKVTALSEGEFEYGEFWHREDGDDERMADD